MPYLTNYLRIERMVQGDFITKQIIYILHARKAGIQQSNLEKQIQLKLNVTDEMASTYAARVINQQIPPPPPPPPPITT